MNRKTKSIILFIFGLAVSIIPASAATLSYFPLWKERGNGALLSGFTLLLLLISSVPLWKFLKRILKSPSAWMLWLLIFIIFYFLSKISNEVTIISFVGFISNICGCLLFKLSKKYRRL